jgi:hypothetical protein
MRIMEPRRIVGSSDIGPKQPRSSRRAKRGERFHGLAHDIMNQLTILSLSCSQIRAAVASQCPPHDTDMERIENAVAEMARLMAALARQKHTHGWGTQSPPNDVLFDSTKQR